MTAQRWNAIGSSWGTRRRPVPARGDGARLHLHTFAPPVKPHGSRYSVALTLRSIASEPSCLANRELIAYLAALALAALTVILRIAALNSPGQPAESRHVAQVYAVDQLGDLLDSGSMAAAPLAWLQLGGYTTLTNSFSRYDSALSAVREPMVLAAAASAILVWLLAARIGLTRWTAAAAVAITALSPLAVSVQVGVRPENIAMPWVLAALVLLWTPRRHRKLAPDLWATAFLVVAVITAPITLVLVTSAAWLIWRRRRKRLSLMLSALFLLGIGIGLGSATTLNGFSVSADGPTPENWLALDPALAAMGAFAAVSALFSFRLRPIAGSALVLIAITLLPGGPGIGAVTLLVPLAALLVAGTVECGITHRARIGKHTMVRPLLAPTLSMAFTAAIFAVPAWVGGLHTASASDADSAPGAAAAHWLSENLPETPVLTDENTWADLIRAGRPTATVTRSVACADTCPAQSWLVVTPALRAELAHRPDLTAAVMAGEPVAIFGDRDARIEIHRPSAAGSTADERMIRTQTGIQLADSPAITTGDSVDKTLRTGKADPRVLTILTDLVKRSPAITVTDFPPVDGEDAAAQPRRQVVISGGRSATDLVRFFAEQPGSLRPESVETTTGGVLVRFSPGAPTGLLSPEAARPLSQ